MFRWAKAAVLAGCFGCASKTSTSSDAGSGLDTGFFADASLETPDANPSDATEQDAKVPDATPIQDATVIRDAFVPDAIPDPVDSGISAGTWTYVSDLDWVSSSNAWGPAERDRANGEEAAGDGPPLSIAGQQYEKGIGVNAPSEIYLDLGGRCDRFQAALGLDDEILDHANDGATVVFEVWADGRMLYQSGLLTAASHVHLADVPIQGAQSLRLVVTDGGDGPDYDHADWAEARVRCTSPSDAGTGRDSGPSDAGVLDASSPSQTFGLLPNGSRDKMVWPFASTSPWNMPIGSGATYQPAGLRLNSGSGYPTQFVQDQDVVIMRPSAPRLDVSYNGEGWGGGDRCAVQGAVLASVPVPADYVLGNSGENNSTAVLAADGRTVKQNQPFTRCVAGGPATTLVTFPDEDIYGDGIHGSHGGSGLSALGGTIRVGEFSSGAIHHVMKVNMWAAQYYHCCSPHWPALVVDSYADANTYGGPNANLGPGALVALPPSFNSGTLQTEPGRILARAFQDYGAYVVDDTYWNAWAIATEQGPDGRVVEEFERLYGFPMRPGDNDPFKADMVLVFEALQIVTNNTASNLGGGGTPRVTPAPAIGN